MSLLDPRREVESTTETYLCIGHPAWPDPLHNNARDALAWYRENIDHHPGIRLVRVVTMRETPWKPTDEESYRCASLAAQFTFNQCVGQRAPGSLLCEFHDTYGEPPE